MVTKKTSSMSEPTFTEKKISSRGRTLKNKKIVKKYPSQNISASPKKMSRNEKRNKIKKDLIEIYENRTYNTPDMSSYKYRKGGGVFRAFLTLIFSLVFLGAVAWLGFFVFGTGTKFSENDVILTVSGEENVVAGQEVQYRIRYKNTQPTEINNAVLKVNYPEGFVFEHASQEPSSEANDTWNFAEIKPGDGGVFDIFGRAYMNLGESQSIRAFLTYTPGNFSSEFQKVATLNTTVNKTEVGLSVDMQKDIPKAFETPISITVTDLHTLHESIDRAVLIVESDILSIKNRKEHEDSLMDNEWELDMEKKSDSISFTGSFDSEDNIPYTLKVKIIGLLPGKNLEDGFTLAEEDVEFNLSETAVSSAVIINGGVGDLTVQPGEKMNTSVVIKNTGEQSLKDVRVRLVFDAPSVKKQSILHWAQIDDPKNGKISGEQINDNTRRGEIIWDKSNIKELVSISQNESVTIDLTLPTKDSNVTDLTSFDTYIAKVFADVQYNVGDETTIVSSNPIQIIINSDTSFEVREDKDVEPDSQTMYTLTWLISNSFHELKNIKVISDFFGDVSFDEKSVLLPPAGKTIIDESKKRLTWTVESMPTALDILAYQFKVKLHKVNAGQTQFTSKITFEAEDIITGEKILIVAPAIEM